MPDIKQRITLDGASEIRTSLNGIALAAQNLADKLRGLSAGTGLDKTAESADGLKTSLVGVQQEAEGLGSKFTTAFLSLNKGIQDSQQSLGGLGSSFAEVGAKVALTFGGLLLAAKAATSALASAAADSVAAIGSSADAAGLSVEKFQRLQAAAAKSGTGNDAFNKGIADLKKQFDQAAGGASDLSKAAGVTRRAYEELGVTVTSFSGQADKSAKSVEGLKGSEGKAADGLKSLSNSYKSATDGARGLATTTGITQKSYEEFGVTVTSFGSKIATGTGSKNIFDALGVSSIDSAGKIKSFETVLTEARDIFSRLPESQQRALAGNKEFGDSVRLLDGFLKESSANVAQYGDDFEKTGRGISQAQRDIADGLKFAQDDLTNALTATRDQIGLLFAPGKTDFTKFLTGLVDGLRPLAVELATAAVEATRLFTGDPTNRQAFIDGIKFAVEVLKDMGRIIRSAVGPAFILLNQGIEFVARSFKDLTGTEISKEFVTAAGGVIALTRAFGLLSFSTEAVVGAFTLFAGLLTGLGPLSLLAAAGVVLYFDKIAEVGGQAFDILSKHAEAFRDVFKKLLAGDFSGAFEALKKAGEETFKDLRTNIPVIGDIVDAVGETFLGLRDNLIGVFKTARILLQAFAVEINVVFGTSFTDLTLGATIAVLAYTKALVPLASLAVIVASGVRILGGALTLALVGFASLARLGFVDVLVRISDAFKALVNGDLPGALDKLGASFNAFFTNLKDASGRTWAIIALGALAAFSLIRAGLTSLGFTFFGVFSRLPAIAALLDLLRKGFFNLIATGLLVADAFKKIFSGDIAAGVKQLVATIKFAFKELTSADAGTWAEIALAATLAFGGIGKTVALIFGGLGFIISKALQASLALFGSTITAAITAAQPLIVAASTTLGRAMGVALRLGLILGFVGVAIGIAELLSQANRDATARLIDNFDRIWPAIKGGAAAAFNEIRDIIVNAIGDTSIWDKVKSGAASAWKSISGVVTDALQAIKDTPIWQGISATASAAWDAIKDKAAALDAALGGIFSSIGNALSSAFTTAIKFVSDQLDTLLEKATKVAAAIGKALTNPGNVPATGNPGGDFTPSSVEIPAPDTSAFETKVSDAQDVLNRFSETAGQGFTVLADRTSEALKQIGAVADEVAVKLPRVFTPQNIRDFGKEVAPVQKSLQDIGTTGDSVFLDLQKKAEEFFNSFIAGGQKASEFKAQFADFSINVDTTPIDDLQTKLDALKADIQAAQSGLPSGAARFDASQLRPSTNIEDRRGQPFDPNAQQTAQFDPVPLLQAQQQVETGFSDIVTAAQALPDQIGSIWTTIAQQATAAFSGIGPQISTAISGAIDGVRSFIGSVGQDLSGGITAALSGIDAAVSGLIASINSQLASLEQRIAAVIAAAQAAATAAQSASDASTAASPAFASGGSVAGPGTGTSDSILARLSNGEFVIRAAIVQKLGVPLLNAINGGADLRKLLRGFSVGGLVDAMAMPRFAGGGMVAVPATVGHGRDLHPITLNIGSDSIAGLLAPRDVAEKLTRYAQQTGVRAIGRSPSWRNG